MYAIGIIITLVCVYLTYLNGFGWPLMLAVVVMAFILNQEQKR